MCLLAVSKSQAKKTPLGERGVRVIVVVANLVSVQRIGLWWIVVVVVTVFLLLLFILFLVDPLLLASMSVFRFRIYPASQKPFLCATIYKQVLCQNEKKLY